MPEQKRGEAHAEQTVEDLSKGTINIKYLISQEFAMADYNPANFANRPQEEVEEIARKGGQSSHSSGFASMDPDKQRDISSKVGKASGGSFEPGSERAREAGRKGGKVAGGGSRMVDEDEEDLLQAED